MGLKNKVTLFDLVQGSAGGVFASTNTTGEMENIVPPSFDLGSTSTLQQDSLHQIPKPPSNSPFQDLDGVQGPLSQLPSSQASQAHIDSLQSVPGPPSNSPFQDLNGLQGPQSQLPTAQASQVHIDSLQSVPGPPSNSPFQDLDGVPDPLFNTLEGTVDSPFQSATGDHMVGLLNNNTRSTNTGNIYESSVQDLNGNPGPNFDLGEDSTLQPDSLLTQVPGGDSNSPFQDSDGVDGGEGYFHGADFLLSGQGIQLNSKDLHVGLLNNSYQYSHQTPVITVNGGIYDLNGVTPSGYTNPDTGNLF